MWKTQYIIYINIYMPRTDTEDREKKNLKEAHYQFVTKF